MLEDHFQQPTEKDGPKPQPLPKSQQPAPAQEVEPQQEGTINWWPTAPPGFAEITWSQHGDNLPRVDGVPLELAKDQSPIQMGGFTMLSAQLFQDVTSGAMCVGMVICSMNLVGIGFIPLAEDHPIPTLLEEIDSEWVPDLPYQQLFTLHQWLFAPHQLC